MNLTAPGTSREWKHTAFVLLRVTRFTQQNGLKVHPCCDTRFLSKAGGIPPRAHATFRLSSIRQTTPGLLCLLATAHHAAVKARVHGQITFKLIIF